MNSAITPQLALPVHFREEATFENFYPADNQFLFQYLQTAIDQDTRSFIYIWGAPGSGRTHLLQACCQRICQQNKIVSYLPLENLAELSPSILEGLESFSWVCIDDLNKIVGNAVWEEALFHCYNRLLEADVGLIMTGNVSPKALPIQLADLKSRFTSSVIFQLKALDDEQKQEALQSRAKQKGLQLGDDVAQFLLNHYTRDTQALFALLEKLDQASLAAQRKLTIPFVKQVLKAIG